MKERNFQRCVWIGGLVIVGIFLWSRLNQQNFRVANPNANQVELRGGKLLWDADNGNPIETQVKEAFTQKHVPRETNLLAIAPFASEEDISAVHFQDVLLNAFSSHDGFHCVERPQIEKVMQEKQITAQNMTDTRAAELGGTLGADYIIIGAVHKAPRGYEVFWRIVTVKNSKILMGGVTKFTTNSFW